LTITDRVSAVSSRATLLPLGLDQIRLPAHARPKPAYVRRSQDRILLIRMQAEGKMLSLGENIELSRILGDGVDQAAW